MASNRTWSRSNLRFIRISRSSKRRSMPSKRLSMLSKRLSMPTKCISTASLKLRSASRISRVVGSVCAMSGFYRLDIAIRFPRCDQTGDALCREGLFRVVGRAGERAADDLVEALGLGQRPECLECGRGDELDDRQMLLGRLEVLAHREDVDSDRSGVLHRLFDLGVGLAQAEH